MTTTPEEPAGEPDETGLPTAPDEVEEADEGGDGDDTPPVVPSVTNG